MEYNEMEVWKEAKELVKLSYSIANKLPNEEQFGLVLQMKRAAISIPSNIAEGIGRNHTKDTIQFLYVARGSLYELETQLLIAKEIFNISDELTNAVLSQTTLCKKLINGTINYFRKKLN